jgi:hypothetical protein
VVEIGFFALDMAPTADNGQNSHIQSLVPHDWSCELVAPTV